MQNCYTKLPLEHFKRETEVPMKSKKKKKIQVRNETDQQENAITGNLVRWE